MLITDLKEWLSVTATVIALATTLYVWLTSRASTNSTRIEELEEAVNELERDNAKQDAKIEQVMAELAHMPDKESVHSIELTMQEIKGSLHALSQGTTQLTRSVERMEDYLLKPGGGAER